MKQMVKSLWIFLAVAWLPLFAAEIVKENNTDALDTGSSWVGGVAPTATGVGVWNSTVAGANSSVLNGAVTWDGVKVTNPGGAVTIAGGGMLTLDGGAPTDINMAAATQDLTVEVPVTLLSSAQQIDILSGRTLRFAGPLSVGISGNWARKGTGILVLDGPVASVVNTTMELQKGTTILTGVGGGLNLTAAGGRIYVGRYSGGDAILIVSNGVHQTGSTSAEASANFVGVGARGRLFMEGGSLSVIYLRCGINGGSTLPSEIMVNHGTLEVTGGGSGLSSYALMIGNNHQNSTSATSASGILTVNGGAAIFTNGIIKIGSESSSSTGAQVINLNGGELALRQIYVGASVQVPKSVTLNGGLLRVVESGDLFAGAGAANGTLTVNVGDGGAVIDTGVSDVTVIQPLLGVGMGGLTKLGGGTLFLSGASTYTGKTRVLGGMLGFGGNAAVLTPDLAVVSGAGLTLRDGALTTFAPSALSIGGVSSSELELELAADGSGSDVLAVPAGATLGVLVVTPLIQGTTTPAQRAGDYDIITYTDTAPDVSGFSVTGQATGRTYEFVLNAGPKTVTLRIGYVAGLSEWITAGGGAWETGSNWTIAPPDEAGATVFLGSAITAPATVTAAAPLTLGGMVIDNDNMYTLAGGGYTFDNDASDSYLTVERGTHQVTASLTVPDALSVDLATGTALTLGGVVAGAGELVKDGGGELTVTQPNTYSGGTVLRQGPIIFDGTPTLGAGVVTAAGGSGLRINTAAPLVLDNDFVITSSVGINTALNDLTLTGMIDWQGGGACR